MYEGAQVTSLPGCEQVGPSDTNDWTRRCVCGALPARPLCPCNASVADL